MVAEIATKYAVDGVHLDYLRFPTDAFDYSRATLAAFRAQHAAAVPAADRQRLDARAANDPAAWTMFLPEGWTTYRRDRLTALATRLVASVRKARPQAIVSVAVGKNADESAAYRFQDWRSWGAAETFDALCPMIYTEDAQEFADLLGEGAPGRRAHAAVGRRRRVQAAGRRHGRSTAGRPPLRRGRLRALLLRQPRERPRTAVGLLRGAPPVPDRTAGRRRSIALADVRRRAASRRRRAHARGARRHHLWSRRPRVSGGRHRSRTRPRTDLA